jgi:hypothetical protein
MNFDRLNTLNVRLTFDRLNGSAVGWFKRTISVIKRLESLPMKVLLS